MCMLVQNDRISNGNQWLPMTLLYDTQWAFVYHFAIIFLFGTVVFSVISVVSYLLS